MAATAENFRKLVLTLPGTEEFATNHFSVDGQEFATLFPAERCAILRMPREIQLQLVASSNTFETCEGAWGKKGATAVKLDQVNEDDLWLALMASWKRFAPDYLREGE